MEARMKRRSSFFRRDLQPEDESLSTTADDRITDIEPSSKTELNEDLLRQHISDLKAEQKEWIAESNNVKLMLKNLLKERKKPPVKVNKSDLYAMLSESDKAKYSVLFTREDYAPLRRSIEDLKKNVALVSLELAHNQSQVESRLRQHSNQGLFENLMNQLAAQDSGCEDWAAGSEGDEMSDFLEDTESEEEMMETD